MKKFIGLGKSRVVKRFAFLPRYIAQYNAPGMRGWKVHDSYFIWLENYYSYQSYDDGFLFGKWDEYYITQIPEKVEWDYDNQTPFFKDIVLK